MENIIKRCPVCNDILVCKLLAMHDERSPYFYLPGGRVAMGETAENAVIREVQEELCIYNLMYVSDTGLLEKGNKFISKEEYRIHSFEWYDIS